MERHAAQALVDAAHQVCAYSHATRGNIDVAINLVYAGPVTIWPARVYRAGYLRCGLPLDMEARTFTQYC